MSDLDNLKKLLRNNLSNIVSVKEVRRKINSEDLFLGKRTIEFYARYGLLRKSIKIIGDKKAYYKRDYIFKALLRIIELKEKGYSLEEIKLKMQIRGLA